MIKEKIKKKVPEVRFEGFEGEWERKKLSQVVNVNSGQDYKHLSPGNIPVYGTGGYMLSVNDALSFNQDAIGIGRKGTINKPYILKAPFWTVDTLFYAIPNQDVDLYFTFNLFQKINWKQKDESTGVPSLSKVAINDTDIKIPNYNEQSQIGTLFQQLDNQISHHRTKLQKLQQVKQAMLTKMFPQDGAKIPEVRFEGFEGEWEEKKLGEIGEIVTGSTPTTTNNSFYSENGTPWVTPTDINNNITYNTAKRLSKEGEKVSRMVPAYTILVTSIASIGKNTLLGCKGSFNQQINGLIPNFDKYDAYFLYSNSYHWSNKMKKSAGAGTMQIVNKTEFSQISTLLPSLPEQSQIGSFFQQLDTLLAQHQKRLDKLGQIKSALLDKLFV